MPGPGAGRAGLSGLAAERHEHRRLLLRAGGGVLVPGRRHAVGNELRCAGDLGGQRQLLLVLIWNAVGHELHHDDSG